MNIYFLPVEPFAEGDIFDVQTDPKGQCLTENDEVKLRIFSVNKRDWFTQRAIVSIKSYLNRVELHCFLLFCIHLKLELLQMTKKYFNLFKIYTTKIKCFVLLSIC